MSDKIPVELASMVADFEGVKDITEVEKEDDYKYVEWHIIATVMWNNAVEYLKEHNYEITGVDIGAEGNKCRIWIRKEQ